MSVVTRTMAAVLTLLAVAQPACAPRTDPIVGEWVLDADATLAQTSQGPRSAAGRDAVTTMRFRYHFSADGTVGVSFRHGMQYWARTGLWTAEDDARYLVSPGSGTSGWDAYTVTVQDGVLHAPAPQENGAQVVLTKRATRN